MKKVAIYTRVSTDGQASEGFSLQAQYDAIVNFVRAQGWELIRVYTDPGVSAKDLNRPGVKEMITDLKAGKFDGVLVHKLDRLTRNIGDLYDLVELVNEYNVKLISLSENIDTSTPGGRMFVYFLGIFAQLFRENLREETLKGLQKRAQEGLRNTFAPFGYERGENGSLIPVPEQAEIVRNIFDLYANKRYGFSRIVLALNQPDSYTGLRGGYMHESTVQRILTNYTYIGKNHWKKKDAPESERIIRDADHEPIVDEVTFQRAQDIMKRRSLGEMSRSSYDHPFSTILRCGACGGPYHGQVNGKEGYRTYRCFNRLKRGTCSQSDISEFKVEKLFFEHFRVPTEVVAYEEVLATSEVDVSKERKRIEKALAQSESRRRNWQYAFGDGKLPYEDYVKLIDAEMLRVQELQIELDNLPDEQPVFVSRFEAEEIIRDISDKWQYLERSTRKEFITTLFKAITILKTEEGWTIQDVEWA
ncbi:recombinase family protein [Paenibacillus sp. TRM 82003]|nr:recombinase family protein [Paenibacillus sp. TRM 82003]